MKCSIICNTYNHEKTIAMAIDSFLIQKTNFSFEILIHDDASEDSTQNIIKSYMERYPNIIKAILQKKNMTQSGYSVTEINLERAKGEYITFCEGDDYWIDSERLQKLVDILEGDSDITLVGHASMMQNHRFPYFRRVWKVMEGFLNMDDLICNRGIVFANNAVMIRANVLNYPEYSKMLLVQDTKRVIFARLTGKIFAINEVMSVYQQGIPGSWTDRTRFNAQKMIRHYQSEYQFFTEFDIQTNKKFHESVQFVLNHLDYLIALHGQNSECFKGDYHNSLAIWKRLKNRLHFFFPKLYLSLGRIRYRYFI